MELEVCPTCKGQGFVEDERGDRSEVCPRCHGSGTVVAHDFYSSPHLELEAWDTADGDDRADVYLDHPVDWEHPFKGKT